MFKERRAEVRVAAMGSEGTADCASLCVEKLTGRRIDYAEVIERHLLSKSMEVDTVFMGVIAMPVDAAHLRACGTYLCGMRFDERVEPLDEPGRLAGIFPDPAEFGFAAHEQTLDSLQEPFAVAAMPVIYKGKRGNGHLFRK
jgi:hypothetical protein